MEATVTIETARRHERRGIGSEERSATYRRAGLEREVYGEEKADCRFRPRRRTRAVPRAEFQNVRHVMAACRDQDVPVVAQRCRVRRRDEASDAGWHARQ